MISDLACVGAGLSVTAAYLLVTELRRHVRQRRSDSAWQAWCAGFEAAFRDGTPMPRWQSRLVP